MFLTTANMYIMILGMQVRTFVMTFFLFRTTILLKITLMCALCYIAFVIIMRISSTYWAISGASIIFTFKIYKDVILCSHVLRFPHVENSVDITFHNPKSCIFVYRNDHYSHTNGLYDYGLPNTYKKFIHYYNIHIFDHIYDFLYHIYEVILLLN